MKSIFYILFLELLASCNSKSSITEVKQDSLLTASSDTCVVGQIIPSMELENDFVQKEYFVTIGNDTSSLSWVVTEITANGRVSLRCRSTPYGKIFSLFASRDTIAVTKQEFNKKSYYKSRYEDQIRELKLILNRVSQDYNLNKLSTLSFFMTFVDGLSEIVTEDYLQIRKELGRLDYSEIESIIDRSMFKKDVMKFWNRIL